jgi:predicted metal-binding membrane protein
MDRIQKIILLSIISIAAISWVLSKDQPDMMNYNPLAISLFTISWTIGMAAMMFPAITPMVLIYTRLIKRSNSSSDGDTVGKGTASSQYLLSTVTMMLTRLPREQKDRPYFQFSLVLLP